MYTKSIFFYLMCCCCASTYAQNSLDKLKQALDSDVPKRMEEKYVPGLALAIFDDGVLVHEATFGWADESKKIRIDKTTGFNIGSISKMFTAWGVMLLIEKGKIQLDEPVEKYLSRWKLPASDFDKEKVTVRALLSHTAGISVHGYPGFPPEMELPSLEASLNGENGPVRANEKVEIVLEPQTQFKYSGGGYTILQLLIEEISQQSFANYMQESVFKPLQMKHTSFTIDKKILKKSAQAYDEAGKEIPLERFSAQAAAGLHTTLSDLVLFIKASLQGNELLSANTLKQMQTPLAITKGQYGLGYMTLPMGKIKVRGHAGSNDGWESAVLIDFKLQSGMIMLSNGSQGKEVLIATLRQWAKWKMAQL